MNVKDAIRERRAYRSLEKLNIDENIINQLAESVRLTPSCFNNQPWKFVFVYNDAKLDNMKEAIPEGNKWAYNASMYIVVFTKKELDCVIKEREYYLFDTGMATAFLILQATELGLVAHPIAGFNPEKTAQILNIPKDMNIITILVVGKKSNQLTNDLTDAQKQSENKRPERINFDMFVYHNVYE